MTLFGTVAVCYNDNIEKGNPVGATCRIFYT